MTCTKIGMRAENLSENVKQYRNKYSREYKERERRVKGIQKRNLVTPRFNGRKLHRYLSRYIVTDYFTYNNGTKKDAVGERTFLNGIPLTPEDASYIRKLRTGAIQHAVLERIDKLAVDYDLPLWELQDAAGCYKEDRRTTKRKRKLG